MGEDQELEASRIKELLRDRLWRLSNLYWITDKYGRKVRFKPNVVQMALIENLHALNIALKSRQHGITTLACILALDMCLFRSGTQAGIVAHTAGDAAKFFRKKVLYAYDNLPDWLKRYRKAVRRDMREGVLELSNGSSLEVSVSHRGGTLQFLHISEYGPMCAMFPERAQEVASGALNAIAPGNIVIIESTAYGSSGDFYERCQTAMDLDKRVRAGVGTMTSMDYKFHFFPWFMDDINTLEAKGVVITPEMDAYFDRVEEEMDTSLTRGQRAWYYKKAEEQREKMTREQPSTPDEAFSASTDSEYYTKEMSAAEAQGRILDLPIDPSRPVFTFWDIGRSDSTTIWFMQENGAWFDFIDYYEAAGEQLAHFLRELQRRGYLYGKAYWPHDGDNTDWSSGEGKTRRQIAQAAGFRNIEIVPRIEDVTQGIDMVRQVLPRCRFDKTRCGPQKAGNSKGGLECLKRYQKKWNPKTETYSDRPLHNWASNGADAFRQFAQGYKTSSGRDVAKRPTATQDNWRTA